MHKPTTYMIACLFAVCATVRVGLAENLEIQGLTVNGQLTFQEVKNATEYRIEWTHSPNGTWTNSWESLNHIPAHGSGVVTAAVPMWFRVVAVVTNPPELVRVSGGTFMMQDVNWAGSPTGSLRTTTVNDFYIGRYEVTLELWQGVYDWAITNGYQFSKPGSGCDKDHPVHSITWYDMVKWCNARSQKEGLTPVYYTNEVHSFQNTYRSGLVSFLEPYVDWEANGYRLPMEAEWEFAASGGLLSQGYIYSGSSNYSAVGWYIGNYAGAPCNYMLGAGTRSVGGKLPNELGLYDMSGNVEERCWDWYGFYEEGSVTNTHGPTGGSLRVTRGGCYSSDAVYGRTAKRYFIMPNDQSTAIGFRLVRTTLQ